MVFPPPATVLAREDGQGLGSQARPARRVATGASGPRVAGRGPSTNAEDIDVGEPAESGRPGRIPTHGKPESRVPAQPPARAPAARAKRQATSDKRQATSDKRQATSDKRQATSDKRAWCRC